MDLLPWIVLLFLLSAGTSLADVDVNWLTRIVKNIRKEYKIETQFCLAANIPLNQDPNTLNSVLQDDSYSEKVKPTLESEKTYQGTNVVVAKPSGPVHAEPQVLTKLQPLIKNKQGRFLLIYSYLSPCEKCTGDKKYNILKYIEKSVLPNWKNVAFVFTKVFNAPKHGAAPTETDLINSLAALGESGLGLENIFRCFGPTNSELQCHSCSSNREVSEVCVKNDAAPGRATSSKRRRAMSEGETSSKQRRRGPNEHGQQLY